MYPPAPIPPVPVVPLPPESFALFVARRMIIYLFTMGFALSISVTTGALGKLKTALGHGPPAWNAYYTPTFNCETVKHSEIWELTLRRCNPIFDDYYCRKYRECRVPETQQGRELQAKHDAVKLKYAQREIEAFRLNEKYVMNGMMRSIHDVVVAPFRMYLPTEDEESLNVNVRKDTEFKDIALFTTDTERTHVMSAWARRVSNNEVVELTIKPRKMVLEEREAGKEEEFEREVELSRPNQVEIFEWGPFVVMAQPDHRSLRGVVSNTFCDWKMVPYKQKCSTKIEWVYTKPERVDHDLLADAPSE